MAEKYIINMPLKSTPDDTDLMIIEDAQDTKRMTWANVVKPIKDLVDNIFESGSNANGRYIKFDDGTMICEQAIEIGSRVSVGAGTFADPYRTSAAEWTFPASFITEPVLIGSGMINSAAVARANTFCFGTITTHLASSLQLVMTSSASTDADCIINVIAIGRWK